MKVTSRPTIARASAATMLPLALALVLLAAPARAAQIVNVTIHIEGGVFDNPAPGNRSCSTVTCTSS